MRELERLENISSGLQVEQDVRQHEVDDGIAGGGLLVLADHGQSPDHRDERERKAPETEDAVGAHRGSPGRRNAERISSMAPRMTRATV